MRGPNYYLPFCKFSGHKHPDSSTFLPVYQQLPLRKIFVIDKIEGTEENS